MQQFPEIVRLHTGDIPDVVGLSQSVGWDYAPAELTTAFASGSLVGVRDGGALLACAGIFPYPGVASLGLVIVRPDAQGRGLGRRVTEACLALAGDLPIILAATEAGQPVYEKLGFRTVGTLHKLFAARWEPLAADRTGPLPADLEALDAAAFGAPRTAFLAARVRQSCDRAGLPGGFALATQAPEVRVIGPLVAPDADAALALADALARRHAGRLRIDVPSEHAGFVAALQARGFALDRVVPVMALRPERLPAGDGTRFAIAAQAFG